MFHERLTYSVEQAAAALGISRAKAYESVRSGELPAVPLGRRLIVPAQAVDAVLGLAPETSPSKAINEVQVAGRLTRPPEERRTRSGKPMATLRLAIGGGEHTVFIDVVVFGKLVDGTAGLTTGQSVGVTGRIGQREWTAHDGTRRSAHQIVARRLEALEPPRQSW